MKTSSKSQEATEGVSLLTSLLLRFPEFGSASLDQRKGEIRLEFYLDSEVDSERFEAFVAKFRMSWELFFDIVRVTPRCHRLAQVVDYPTLDPVAPGDVMIVRIVRDLESLSFEELSLMGTLIRTRFIATLIGGEPLEGAEARYQERVLQKSLDQIRVNPSSLSCLTGFRDEMRILVYSSESPDLGPISKGRA